MQNICISCPTWSDVLYSKQNESECNSFLMFSSCYSIWRYIPALRDSEWGCCHLALNNIVNRKQLFVSRVLLFVRHFSIISQHPHWPKREWRNPTICFIFKCSHCFLCRTTITNTTAYPVCSIKQHFVNLKHDYEISSPQQEYPAIALEKELYTMVLRPLRCYDFWKIFETATDSYVMKLKHVT